MQIGSVTARRVPFTYEAATAAGFDADNCGSIYKVRSPDGHLVGWVAHVPSERSWIAHTFDGETTYNWTGKFVVTATMRHAVRLLWEAALTQYVYVGTSN